jgi:hypothetical protein
MDWSTLPSMKTPHVIPRRPCVIAGLLLALFILIAAAVNVPCALSFMRSRTTKGQLPMAILQDAKVRQWPAETPHKDPWPAPDFWWEGGVFGCRVYDVRARPTEDGAGAFSMSVQHLGWPLPVIEEKQMWWDWNDPSLNGPESDPAPSLLLPGLVLNPLILGGAAWIVFVLPWLALLIGRRWSRHRRRRCMACGYPVGRSPVCTECGGAVAAA